MKTNSLNPSDYVHLHNHTQYSLLDGLTKVPALMDFIKEKGMKAVAITDHGTLSGLIEFYKEAKSSRLKPILGMETYVAPRLHTDKDPAKDKLNNHLIILAMNQQGYHNLMRLSTIANLDGFYYKPRIDHDLLEKYNEGLIVLSGCIGGEVGDALRQDQYDAAKKTAQWYKKVFGDRYYLEIQDHGHKLHPKSWKEQVKVTESTFRLAKELEIQAVLTCDAHYLKHEDQQAHEILLCVQTGSFLTDEKRMSLKDFDLNVVDPVDLIKRWGSSNPEIITNSLVIAERCNVSLDFGKILIPKFDLPINETEKTFMDRLVYQGLTNRYANISEKKSEKMSIDEAKKLLPKKVLSRASYEMSVIDKMGFNGYFLIIADFIKWGKSQRIVFGPGRGSAAGSIIAYALKITELDPLEYDLLFERFLNPDRISMPDIDIDIQDNRRDEVIKYCIQKYGENRVANIVTFGRMAARNAVRDVARVLQVPYADADRWSKMIPAPIQGRHIPLSKSLTADKDLKQVYENDDQAKIVFDLAIQMEGTIRSHGVHAAGVVIAPDDIVLFVPLEKAQKGVVATQYPMGPIEDLGLLKMDFLGLSNLTTINNALRIIKKVYNKSIDINTIPLDDLKTYQLLQRGDTTGIFQFESQGMKRYLKDLKPTVFDDIIAMGALYRPGPLGAGLTQRFIDRKNGKEKIEYAHKSMRSALGSTYGVLVYQEQVMRIAKDMCGFSGGDADTLRKAIGKKKRDVMAKMKEQFITGAIEKSNVDRDFVEKFWKDLEGFADYAFNKSHSACYGLISYQTAYLKAHYPAAYMASLMTSDYDDTDRLAIEITECKKIGIDVLAPDINESFLEFAVVPKEKQIRFGLAAIKNVGAGAVDEILNVRPTEGFKNLQDFFSKVNNRIINRKVLESLIKSGAFDRFGERSFHLANLDIYISYASRKQKQFSSGQTDLFGNLLEETTDSLPQLKLDYTAQPIPLREQLMWERELLGLYLSQHPLKAFEGVLSEYTVPLNTLSSEHDNKSVSVGGSIVEIREITTKNGQKMAFVKIADQFKDIELVLFPGIYQQTTGIWERDRVVIAKGKINAKDRNGQKGDELKILVEDVREVTHEQAAAYETTGKKIKTPKPSKLSKKVITEKSHSESEKTKRLYLKLENSNDQKKLLDLKILLDKNVGQTEVVLVLGDSANKQIIRLPVRVDTTRDTLNLFGATIGKENVILQ